MQHAAEPGMFQFWSEEKLRNMDTDQFGHVNNAAIATFCESGRMSVFAGPEISVAMAAFQIVVARLLIDFHKELFFPGIVMIGTSISKVGNTSFQVVQGIFNGSVEVASSQATCVLIDTSSKKPTPIPGQVRTHLSGAPASRHPTQSSFGVEDVC